MHIRIGTRASPLAMWQANHVASLLRGVDPASTVELVTIQTTGDQIRDVPLAQIGGEGVFTKAIQTAILESRADIAVHSLKDLPTFSVDGLVLTASPARGPVGDVLVSKSHQSFDKLPQGAKLATSSIRRRVQLLHKRPDLVLVDIRGNVETRLRMLTESKELAGIILAQAGLDRLGLASNITEILDPSWMLPAVGQGAIGLECRADDHAVRGMLDKVNHSATYTAALAERAFLRALGGGCQVPIGAVTLLEGDLLTLRGAILAPDASWRIEGSLSRPTAEAEKLGELLAAELMTKGGLTPSSLSSSQADRHDKA